MDAHSLDIRALKKSCIHFALPDGRLIPFESYNLFYRDGRESLLKTIRDEIDVARDARRAGVPERSVPVKIVGVT